MSAPRVYLFSLSLITLLNLSTAQQLPARVKAPATTPAHLFIRQQASGDNASCVAGATSCNDGQPGCCAIGQSCAFDASHRPVCAGSCSGGVNCSGDMADLCCDAGATCNTQLTLCEGTDLAMTSMSLTGPVQTEMSTVVATTVVAASSQLPQDSTAPTTIPTSQAMPSAAVDSLSQASSTTTASTFLPAPSENYNNSTLLSSSFPEPGLEFTYTTVFVTDSSSSSSAQTTSSDPEAGDQVTKTVTTIVRSGQGRVDVSCWKAMLAWVLAFGVMIF